MEQFNQKIALITGAASGIGKSIAEHLVRYGATVYATDIKFKDNASDEDKLKKLYLDATSAGAVQAMVDRVVAEQGRLDYIFNNAGFAISSEVRDMTVQQWHDIFNLNFFGVVNGVNAAYPVMIRQGSGHIVNTASLAGITYNSVLTAYSATKHAVVALSMGMRPEAATFGVKVTAFCPGFIKTGIYDAAINNRVSKENSMTMVNRLGLLELDPTVEKLLEGVVKNKALVVLPAYGKVMWWLTRLNPRVSFVINRQTLADFRKHRVD